MTDPRSEVNRHFAQILNSAQLLRRVVHTIGPKVDDPRYKEAFADLEKSANDAFLFLKEVSVPHPDLRQQLLENLST